MYPFGSFVSNLIAFGDFLRREHGFRIGSGELHDAARALEIVDLADELAVRDAFRPVLCRTRDDVGVFDKAFTTFFFPGAEGEPRSSLTSARPEFGLEDAAELAPLVARSSMAPEGVSEKPEVGAALQPIAERELAAQPALVAGATYSPLEVEALAETPQLTRPDPEWREAARALERRLRFSISRRWRVAKKGPRFNLRRTLRASLQTGGEALTVRWLRRPRQTPRFVLLIDGSRSMESYAKAAIHIATALASVTLRLEVCIFSTALQRITDDVRRATRGETRHLEHLRHAWAGGTAIGPCLGQFLRQFGDRVLARDTVVVIVSDGLDVGDTAALREAMRELHRRSACVVWLNPLLETPGYEPTAAGMAAARPYITTFACVNDAQDFARLSRLVRVRA